MTASLSLCFKPQDRKSGEDIFRKASVNIRTCSDTEVRAFLNSSGSHRVSLYSEDLTSSVIHTDCSCSAGRKGRLCKHIWATILQLHSKDADFLENKTEADPGEPKQESEAVVAAKVKQAEYQKLLRNKIKEQKKLESNKQKELEFEERISHPYEVEKAIKFFSDNGIDFAENIDAFSTS